MSTFAIDARRALRILIVTCLGLGLAAWTAPTVDQVNGLLRRAETNLNSVSQNVKGRTEPPKGSAGKLLAQRLQQVGTDLAPAKELLEQIPAGTEGLEEVTAKYTAMAEEYNRLVAFFNGSDAPATPAADSGGTKLDYQQEEILKGAQFNLREVEGNAKQLTESTEKLRAVEDQLSIDYREVAGLLGVVENAQRKSGFVSDALAKLPEDGQGVPETRQRQVNADAQVVTAADYLKPLNAQLQKIIDPASYPEFDADYKRLRELAMMYARPEMLETERELAAETFKQAGAAYDECIRIAQKYARLLQQQTEQSKSLEGVGNGFLGNHAAFLAAAETAKGTLPDAIRADLAQAQQYADDAVAQQKPLWFTGGVPQTMGFAAEKVALLTALDEAGGRAMQGELEQTQQKIKRQADALRDLIIRENKMPEDRFAGEDRDKAIAVAIDAWKHQEKDFKVLKVRIPAEAWARETKWTYSNGTWYFSDRSKLQVRLLIADKDDKKLAIDRAINVWKDHQKGDTMIGVPLWGLDHELQPNDYMLRSNIK
ncbi:MAG: hypothetical protein R3B49_02905 [Phycisphaerales bacterium]